MEMLSTNGFGGGEPTSDATFDFYFAVVTGILFLVLQVTCWKASVDLFPVMSLTPKTMNYVILFPVSIVFII